MSNPGNDCPWTPEQIAQLRALWGTVSTAEIGRRMGLSKNSVVGKAHRIGLASRPSPIKAAVSLKPKKIRRAGTVTLPLLERMAPVVVAAPVPPPRAVYVRRSDRSQCAFPLWHHERPTQRFCSAPVKERLNADGTTHCSPYCAKHHAVCYVRGSAAEPVYVPKGTFGVERLAA